MPPISRPCSAHEHSMQHNYSHFLTERRDNCNSHFFLKPKRKGNLPDVLSCLQKIKTFCVLQDVTPRTPPFFFSFGLKFKYQCWTFVFTVQQSVVLGALRCLLEYKFNSCCFYSIPTFRNIGNLHGLDIQTRCEMAKTFSQWMILCILSSPSGEGCIWSYAVKRSSWWDRVSAVMKADGQPARDHILVPLTRKSAAT